MTGPIMAAIFKLTSALVVICVAQQSVCGLDTETFQKNLTRLKAMEKIKHEILRGLGLNNRPIATPPIQKNLYVLIHNITSPKGRPAEVNEIISFSEAPDNFTDDNIIQFHLAHDTRNKHFTVKSASLLIRVKSKLRHRHRSKLAAGATLREGGKKKNRKIRGRRISLTVSTVGEGGKPLEKIAAVKSRIKKNKWFKVNLPQTLMQNLVDSSNGMLLLYVKCKGCRKNTQVVLVHSGKRKKRQLKHTRRQRKKKRLNSRRPFLILHTMIEARTRRSILDVKCNSRRRNRCCKSIIEVNFRDIGWDDWILYPTSFVTAYCSGVCLGRNSLANQTECVPTKRKSLRLLYQGDGSVYTSSVLPNFVVTRCGCPK